jgi:hypothetical protein
MERPITGRRGIVPEARGNGRAVRARRGVTLLDSLGLVAGAALASVHLRSPSGELTDQGLGVLLWATLAGIALSAAGPLVFLARRFVRRIPDYPRRGDVLWLVLGAPWVLTAPLRMGGAAGRRDAARIDLYDPALIVALGAACLATLFLIWDAWGKPSPDGGRAESFPPWTEAVGWCLAVGWPLQCGFGLVALSA